ncbi:choline sulfate utilization transcriptional regulator [Paraburkholderia azotifigens]|uniref:LysR family transcriptional regulator n=1 Tax=Paraburkholderia azotifigens TaxID=2057004 RepID=A0A5C6VG52_9BURK|nr:LysR substrate-binding domain-containing protein [Paraburkholderia azotifigens]TXC82368.1 LysR family transcriptional regulator [Paraburkholderia azotifigens]
MPGPDRLPPMQALSAFESAARLASFTAAARELGSTQPAVSQRIVQLEEDLGAPLFERGHRGVTLTPEGVLLYEAVRSGLDTIREATSDIRARRATGALTILTDAGFATYWLMPRLARLKASMPGVNVKIITSQLGYDPHRDHADIAIAFGDGHWPPCTSTRLFAEAVTPVCSPAFQRLHPPVHAAADLAALPLLHVQPTQPERWLAWNSWFSAYGLAAPEESQGMMFNSYSLVVQAALMGQGVALGWTPLTDELVASGQLVRLLDTPVTTERGYYLVCPPARPAPAAVPLFRRWLFNELVDAGEHAHA